MIIQTLATFYLTYCLTQTSGAYNLLDKGRSYFSKDTSFIGGLLHCYWCMSLWVGQTIVFLFPGALYHPIGTAIRGLAVSAIASLMIWLILLIDDAVRSFFQFLAAWLDALKGD